MTKEQVQDIIGHEWEIMFICKTGSQLFCSNPHDSDIMVVIKDYPYEYKKYFVDNHDIFCQSFEAFKKKANFCSEYPSLYALTWQFAKQGDTLIYGEFPLKDWDWFDWKLKAVDEALEIGKEHYFNSRVFGLKKDSCSKQMVWALAIYYAIRNGSINYTSEQLQIMQKCHDFELPKEYANVLKTQLEELKKELEEQDGKNK